MRRGPARSCGPRPPHTLQTAFTTAVTLSPPLPPRCVASVPGVSRRHTRSLFHPLPLYARPPLHCWLVRRQPASPHPPRAPTRPRAWVCASRGRRRWPAAQLVGATARGRHGSRSPDTPATYRYPCPPTVVAVVGTGVTASLPPSPFPSLLVAPDSPSVPPRLPSLSRLPPAAFTNPTREVGASGVGRRTPALACCGPVAVSITHPYPTTTPRCPSPLPFRRPPPSPPPLSPAPRLS